MPAPRARPKAGWAPGAWRSTAFVLMLACGALVPAAQAAELDDARERLARGDAAGALAVVQQALARQPDNAQLRFMQGVSLMDLGRDSQALAVFRELHQQYPELPDPLNNIALLQARAGQLESARQSLQEALRADPQHRAARTNLGQVHLMLAVQAWEQATAGTAGAAADPAVLRKLQIARGLLVNPASPLSPALPAATSPPAAR